MNLLVSFVPLVLLAWSGPCAGALPSEDRPALLGNGVLANEHGEFLLKMLAGLAELSRLEKEERGLDGEPLTPAKFGVRSLAGRPRSPCKNFFWKTFSSC
ncbi:hypothetical protein COCON_G00140910 [Conger conger]|uniref:Somatostatin/Cortistatin C-terminal domain-containing protein n=1 Tax=Conger conger TaxID=82655 RepID=A0A9Q1HTX2_CONCO|nr:somatostatin 6 [Conger conger]KAJ8264992.1 hypothetical protein COCON_G00140910 [Conger conger]